MFSFGSMKNSLNYCVIGCRLLPYADFNSDGIGVQLEALLKLGYLHNEGSLLDLKITPVGYHGSDVHNRIVR